MAEEAAAVHIGRIAKQWGKKRGSLIMMLHAIQDQRGYVPRDAALELARQVDVPLARIYEVLTFYNYFKTSSPGKAVVSVCTGTACHLKGAPDILAALGEELGVADGEASEDGNFHLQSVRCVGCCGLAPVVTVNATVYGKVKPAEMRGIIGQWQDRIDAGEL
ncbi:MAG: NAD(P)H-dependent oxidoreductase subunit E [Planctomycetes bacterium]|jgi:NADH-quinone oxidoreductase subunit E|nr:NAD(P)H-dependent oxidoreductase subunit E [Planctomycetota bacterium]